MRTNNVKTLLITYTTPVGMKPLSERDENIIWSENEFPKYFICRNEATL